MSTVFILNITFLNIPLIYTNTFNFLNCFFKMVEQLKTPTKEQLNDFMNKYHGSQLKWIFGIIATAAISSYITYYSFNNKQNNSSLETIFYDNNYDISGDNLPDIALFHPYKNFDEALIKRKDGTYDLCQIIYKNEYDKEKKKIHGFVNIERDIAYNTRGGAFRYSSLKKLPKQPKQQNLNTIKPRYNSK